MVMGGGGVYWAKSEFYEELAFINIQAIHNIFLQNCYVRCIISILKLDE